MTTRGQRFSALPATWRGLRPLYGGHVVQLLVLVAVSIAAAIAEAAVLVLVANVAAAMVQGTHELNVGLGLHVGVGQALLLALALALVRLLLQLVIAWEPARITADVQARLRRELFDAYVNASWSVQSEDAEGDLQELMTDQINQATQSAMQVVGALVGSVMFLVLVATALAMNAVTAMIVLAAAIVLFWVLRPLIELGRRASREMSEASMDHARGVSESARLAEEAHVFGAASAQAARVSGLIETARRALFRFQLYGRLMQNTYQSLVFLLIVGGLGGLYLTNAGRLASLGAIVLMLVRASSYAGQAQGGFQAIAHLLPYVERLQDATARYRISAPTGGARPLPRIEEIAFEDVHFAYRPDRQVLQGISFSVRGSEAIGIVGPSGAGKSTLVQLLLRLRDPDRGQYLINETSASAFNEADWHTRVAYVAQDPRIMHATVRENICFFRDLDAAAVERAARRAHIHNDIMELPAGYDTVIGQVADALSGGQRQRICLARALAGEPNLLVLDEPTSALDMASEAAVRASLVELQGHLTLFVVAHRMSTISACDRVLVLKDGCVEAFASAAKLEISSSFYQHASALARDGV